MLFSGFADSASVTTVTSPSRGDRVPISPLTCFAALLSATVIAIVGVSYGDLPLTPLTAATHSHGCASTMIRLMVADNHMSFPLVHVSTNVHPFASLYQNTPRNIRAHPPMARLNYSQDDLHLSTSLCTVISLPIDRSISLWLNTLLEGCFVLQH